MVPVPVKVGFDKKRAEFAALLLRSKIFNKFI